MNSFLSPSKAAACLATLGFLAIPTLHAYVVDFNDYAPGTIIDSEYAVGGADNTSSPLPPGVGFTVSVNANGSAPDIATLYDTNFVGGEDPDLEGGPDGNLFQGGGLVGEPQGNALIIQEQASPREIRNGRLDHARGQSSDPGNSWNDNNAPDDNARGGTITLDFSVDLVSFGFNWVDLDGVENFTVTFIDSIYTGSQATIDFGEFTNPGSVFYDTGVEFGDHTANTVSPITVMDVNNSSVSWSGATPNSFDQVRFNFGGSGSISRINFAPVPETGTVAAGLLLVGLIGGRAFKRRRK